MPSSAREWPPPLKNSPDSSSDQPPARSQPNLTSGHPSEAVAHQLTTIKSELTPIPDEQEAWDRALAQRVCLHCGSELGRSWRLADGPFCCRGCRSVYGLIHQAGLGRYYELRRGRQAPSSLMRPDSFAWLDRLLAQQSRGSGPESPLLNLSLDIQGVHCAACVWLLEELFRREEGGLSIRINPSLGKVDLMWDASVGDLRYYLAEVEKFGYRFGPSRKEVSTRSQALLARMAVCIAIALNVMMFSISFYLGLAPADGVLYRFFGWLSLILATVSVLVGGQVFFRAAWAGLKNRIAHLDLPISLGMTLAYLGSLYGFFTDGPEGAYFDSLTVFVALMLIGRWAQEHILERNRNALLTSSGAEHLTTKLQRQGSLEPIAAPDIRRGYELWIAPGDLVPVAGILLRKSATTSLDWITGESDLKVIEPGDIVPAGAFNAGQTGFVITASEDFMDSRLQELLRTGPGAIPGDSNHRQRWWNRVSTVYVVAVLSLATVGFLLWMGQSPRHALEVTVAILVVTCPCAIGLATPLAAELIHFALRNRGVFLRQASFLDKALSIRKILLDKTGTLTLGHLVLTPASRKALWQLAPAYQDKLWNMAARSNHPVSRALAEALGSVPPPQNRHEVVDAARGDRSLAMNDLAVKSDPSCENVAEIPGRGLEWNNQGNIYRLGQRDFALAESSPNDDPHHTLRNPAERQRRSLLNQESASTDQSGRGDETDHPTLFSVNGQKIATFQFNEEFRNDAAEELTLLYASGYDIYLLSGDTPAKVARAAAALGIPQHKAKGGLTPETKANWVRKLDQDDSLMVGDGLNDSPSFAAAHCAATPAIDRPVLPGKADFYFLGDGIAALRWALRSASQLRHVVRDNLILAVIYNLVAVSLCFAGLVTPVVAAIMMPLSSVTVVGLTAYRLSGRRLAWMS